MTDTDTAIQRIRDAVGDKGWLDAPDAVEPYVTEWRGLWRGTCLGVARPASTEEVAAVVSACAAARLPVVALGGNTGLVGGGLPDGGIVLSTERLNRVREVDADNLTMTVEAGCILDSIHAAADEAGLYYPLSLGAEGTCRIGGNLSTNAGGVAVLRYGNARELVLGLEVVLADGTVWNGLRGLRKDNTGYDLKQIFIGAEGTLGIITAAVLKLFPKPKRRETAFVAVPSVDAALRLFVMLRDRAGSNLTAFETTGRMGLELVARHIRDAVDPFGEAHPQYALVELTSRRANEDLQAVLESLLAEAIEAGHASDAVIAQSAGQAADLWRLREAIPEAQTLEGASIKHDVSVPVSRVPGFIREASDAVSAAIPGVRIVAFGHVGDGNVHFNLTVPEGMDRDDFLARWDEANRIVHDIAVGMNGSFSAEHGIGRLKRGDLGRYKSPVEVDMMRRLKQAFDPDGIMNPGKILPD